jgi:DNA-binding transcriptional MerR regulator
MNDRLSKSDLIVLPSIPAKRYFTIGEVSELCGVKPHVLRYWEQEFTQLKPVKRRGNRRYYQHHEVLLIRRIRELLYEQGFTISGARNKLDSRASEPAVFADAGVDLADGHEFGALQAAQPDLAMIRHELLAILALLKPGA